MSKITLDAALQARLNGMNEEVEICDEGGNTVGHFLLESLYQKLLYRLAEAACPYTAEDLARLKYETGGMSLQEFWKTLGRT